MCADNHRKLFHQQNWEVSRSDICSEGESTEWSMGGGPRGKGGGAGLRSTRVEYIAFLLVSTLSEQTVLACACFRLRCLIN